MDFLSADGSSASSCDAHPDADVTVIAVNANDMNRMFMNVCRPREAYSCVSCVHEFQIGTGTRRTNTPIAIMAKIEKVMPFDAPRCPAPGALTAHDSGIGAPGESTVGVAG